MATKLQLYNRALLYCEERQLASLTEDRGPRRYLDQVYDTGGIDTCLEEAMWKFATRAVRLDYDTSLTREFGFLYGFEKPSDWKKTVSMCSDEYFKQPLLDYHHEAGFWYADLEQIYVRYVSNDELYGYALGDWPSSFFNYVAAYFASQIVGQLSGASTTVTAKVRADLEEARKIAKSNDAWNQPQQFPPSGSWVNSRGGGRSGRKDYGNSGSLLG